MVTIKVSRYIFLTSLAFYVNGMIIIAYETNRILGLVALSLWSMVCGLVFYYLNEEDCRRSSQ
ncbi:hypothetical protein SPV2_gp18 [Sulfolobus polyhedral virus 2]|uniref:Uncharacterized protein n=1 Tax=Sulfolobus polyhedral virus 2 TaxID=2493125 RepID=A0A3Q8Q7G1_9VIRU|nr:hypothetical protein KM458_gp18 [Sulfolobus polyhedral virus 2]AZI76017.1 hypothetical protein SPV2_gp18 [Sulfolobus polyhedral virus 2]